MAAYDNYWVKRYSRRQMLRRAAVAGAGLAALGIAGCSGGNNSKASKNAATSVAAGSSAAGSPAAATRAAGAASATAAGTAAGKVTPSGTLNVALVSLGTERFIPRLNNPDDAPIWEMLTDAPIGVSPKDGLTLDPSTGLIEKWDVKQSGESVDLTLKFRPNIPFHKGEGTLKASDFKFTFAQYLKDGSVNPGAGDKKRMINGDINNIEIADNLTAIIHTKVSWARAGFEGLMSFPIGAFYGILPEAYFNKVGGEDGFAKAPVGTGPYQFVEHRDNEFVRFEAVDGHWRKTPAYKTVTFFKVPDAATAVAQLKSGQVDIVGLTPRQLAEVQGNKDINVVKVTNSGEVFVNFGGMFNTSRPSYDPNVPWISGDLLGEKAKAVRQAMTISVDTKAIIDKLLLGTGRQVNVPFLFDVPGTGWYDPKWQLRPYNPNQAKQLLAQAGYPNGFSMKTWVFPLPYNPANADVMEVVAGYWDAIGIKSERQQLEYQPTFRAKLVDRTTAGGAYAYTQPIYEEAYAYLAGSCCFRSDAALAHWEIPFVDQKTDEARLAYDKAKRDQIMKEIGDFIYDNYIGLPIGATSNLWAVRTAKVSNWQPTPGVSWLHGVEFTQRS